MGNATIGSLRAVLGLDTAQFADGLDAAQKELRRASREFEKIGKSISNVGQTLTAGLTLPIIGFGIAAVKTAGDFESSMNKVGISTQATGEKLEALSDLARQIGKDTVFSAETAAGAMDNLAKAGLSVEDILGGAARATVNLAAAAGSELEPAATAISDSMAQFKIEASDLPRVVNQITGAVNESKLDFVDFQQAMGQAGGVAANLGVNFEDFNAVLAATSPLFSSGSDAGTSFKTFLTTLVPKTTGAATAMEQYGLAFHDAAGNLKPMADIAQMLQEKLSGLSDAARTEVLQEIFGTDAMRTAIGLMDQGAAGLDKIAAKIAATDAAAQAAQRMEGLNGQLEELGGAFQEVAIAIGESGLLQVVTDVVTAFAGFMDKISELSPVALQIGIVIAAIAAAFGPVLVVVGSMVSAWGALLGAFAAGGILAGVAGLILPIGLAVGAVAAAFALFGDKIVPALVAFGQAVAANLGPKIAPLIEATKAAFAAFGDLFTTLFPPGENAGLTANLKMFGIIVGTVFGAAADIITGAIGVITNVLRALSALLKGDFSTMWNALGSAVKSALTGIGRAFETIFPDITRWVRNLYTEVKTWLQDKLGAVFNWVKTKVGEVGDAFFRLYDAVVGHSYVPDMVTEVGQWMARLDAEMVVPAKNATEAATTAFETMRDKVAAVFDSLLTEREKLTRDLAADMKVLNDALAAGPSRGGITKAQYDDAVARRTRNHAIASGGLDAEGLTMPDTIGTIVPIDTSSINKTMEQINERIAESREKFAEAFEYGIDSALRGDWKGVLSAIVGSSFQDGLKNIGRSLFDALGGGKAGSGGGGFNIASIGSTIAKFFGGFPGFATGGGFTVGGAGGPDSKLFGLRLSPGEMVDVRKPGADQGPGGGGAPIYQFSGNLMTPEFWAQIQSDIRAGEQRSNQWAATNVPSLAQSQTAKQQQHAVGRRRR